jgi:polyphosphate kinase
MTTLRARSPRSAARRRPAALPYINRELSWLDFNARVLFEARDERNPLLERAKFLAIFASNLDEFFQVRVSGLLDQVASGSAKQSPDGRTAAEQLGAIRARVHGLVLDHARLVAEVRAALATEGVAVVDHAAVPEHHARLRERYLEEIFPVLTPLAVAPGHPFPYISTLSLSLAVVVRDPDGGEQRFARIKVPEILPRLVAVDAHVYVPLEQVIAANLDVLFPGLEIVESHPFRVTRDADFDIEEDEAGDLVSAIEHELRQRRFGSAVRLEVEDGMPDSVREFILDGIGLGPDDAYAVPGILDATCFWQLATLDLPELRDPPWTPVVPARLTPHDEGDAVDVFAAIRQGDILVHHPYESFGASIERFIAQAADDPDVLTIKMTLYRTSGDSPIVRDLIRAAEQGKQVVVLVEIKARFDEEANIVWARKLEQAGAHVVYGLVGLKTHSKISLVVRREGSGLRRYVHLGTGNYNQKTARIYIDLGLLTCRPELGADATDLFNYLTGLSRQNQFRQLLVAPVSLRPRLRELIEREAEHARAGRTARIIVKCNAVVDPELIEALYRASAAGVEIECIIRGICSLQPGVPGVSDRIRARSIVGQFLEHSRIYGFLNGGRQEWYTGSADLMERNLDRRIEAVFPIEDLEAQARLAEIVEVMLADDRRSWQLGADATWRRTEEINAAAGTIDTFVTLMERAERALVVAREPRRPASPVGSLDPRA